MNFQDQPPLAAKEGYFKQLKTLSGSDSDEAADAQEERRRLRHRRFFATRPATQRSEPAAAVATPKQKEVAGSAQRIIKATQSDAKKAKNRVTELLDDDADVVGETPLAPANRKRSRLQTESPSVSSASVTPAAKKRKRASEPVLRPEEEQIFNSLSFYYVPDNDIAPARRLRIAKAREFGAAWTRDVGNATHVVVDRDIGFADVQTLLKRSGVPEGKVVVVGEEYPVDCIQFRAVLDARQKKYLVSGQVVEAEEKADEAEAEKEGDDKTSRHERAVETLKLKEPQRNPAKWDYVPPKGTPDRSEPSSAREGTPVATPPVESQPISLGLDEPSDAGAVTANDELSSYISMMKEFKNLPLENDDEDETASVATHEGGASASEEERSQKPKSRGKGTQSWGQNFACNRAGTLDAYEDGPNARTIAILQRMHAYYERVSDQWRTMAYRKAMATLKRQPVKITTEEEAVQLPGIGRRLAQKIEEIATTDRLRRLEYAESDGGDDVLKLFMGVYGVGPRLARQWISQGHRTLEDLKENIKLTPSQLVGIERHKDLNRKIPRDEVHELGEVVKVAARKVDAEVELIVGGSYRRGAKESNDIDFIVTKPGTTSSSELRPFLEGVVSRLEREKVIVARLASSRTSGGSIWHGCCALPHNEEHAVWRRIDFLLVPESEVGGALIYFTGDDIFNRSMRLLARKKGLRLNQRGLFECKGQGPEAVVGELVEGVSERRIFEVLGVEWREPWERWC